MGFSHLTGEPDRMLLRPYRDSDYDVFADLHGRDDVARHLPWDTRDAEASRVALKRHQDVSIEMDGDGITLAAILKETGDKESGRLVTEGASARLNLGFETMRMHRIIARIDARNAASAAVLTRLGMRKDAHLVKNEMFKGEWSDEADYAILAEEWSNSSTSSVISWNTIAPAAASDSAVESPPPKP